MIVTTLLWTGLVALPASAPQDQDPRPVVARFQLADEPAVVTLRELALEVAFRQRRTSAGKAALKLLVDRHLVERAAAAIDLSATSEEIAERIGVIRNALEQQGRSLEAFLDEKGMDAREFERSYVAMSIAHEKLVMEALDLSDRSEVRPEMLELWLREERSRRDVVEDPDELPSGVAARIDGDPVEVYELGELLLTSIDRDERFKHVRRITLRRLLADQSRSMGIVVDAEETRAEVERRRTEIENDPRFRGVPYEDWLRQTQGITIEDLLKSEQMVATVQQRKIVERLHPPADLERTLREDREAVLRDHGEKRRIAIVLIRALEEPNDIITLDFEAGLERAKEAQARLDEGRPFDDVVATFSDHPLSKVRGGELGEYFRGDDEDVPDALLEAAFAMQPGEVSEPIRVPQGWVLVHVTGLIPTPSDDELMERLRDSYGQKLLADLLERAQLELVDS